MRRDSSSFGEWVCERAKEKVVRPEKGAMPVEEGEVEGCLVMKLWEKLESILVEW